MADIISLPPRKCPRCGEAVQKNLKANRFECSRCTWPNTSWVRLWAIVATEKDLGAEGLQEYLARVPDVMTLRNAEGQAIAAKVIEARLVEGQVEVQYEFDPEGWAQHA